MAEKSPVKKFLIFVSTLLGSIAVVGAVVATSIERRLQGELRSSVFDALKPEWLRTYTFGNPEMLETDLAKVDYEMFYTDLLTGKGFKFSAENNSLTAEDSRFNVQLLEGDRLKFFSNSKEIGDGEVESVTSSNELLLSTVHFHHDSPLDSNEHSEMLKLDSVRYYRPFTGTAYRFMEMWTLRMIHWKLQWVITLVKMEHSLRGNLLNTGIMVDMAEGMVEGMEKAIPMSRLYALANFRLITKAGHSESFTEKCVTVVSTKKGSRMVLRSIFKLMATVNGVKLGS